MIRKTEIRPVGTFNKPHGINGEINAVIPSDIDIDRLKCVVVELDGIFVPFFIEQWRPRSSESVLLKLEGIDNENQAKELTNKELYLLVEDLREMGLENDEESNGFYMSDIIGYTVHDTDGTVAGEITGYDDQTENVLISVRTPRGKTVYLPLADNLIEDFDSGHRSITLDIPAGLIDLQDD